MPDFNSDVSADLSAPDGITTAGIAPNPATGRWDKLAIINQALINSANSTVTTPDDGSDEWRVAARRPREVDEPRHLRQGRLRKALRPFLGYELIGDDAERVGGGVGLCDSLELPLVAWIEPGGQQGLRGITVLARGLQG